MRPQVTTRLILLCLPTCSPGSWEEAKSAVEKPLAPAASEGKGTPPQKDAGAKDAAAQDPAPAPEAMDHRHDPGPIAILWTRGFLTVEGGPGKTALRDSVVTFQNTIRWIPSAGHGDPAAATMLWFLTPAADAEDIAGAREAQAAAGKEDGNEGTETEAGKDQKAEKPARKVLPPRKNWAKTGRKRWIPANPQNPLLAKNRRHPGLTKLKAEWIGKHV